MENKTVNFQQMTYPFENINLPYSCSALEPYIDSKTIEIHYKILSHYIEKLNMLLDNHPEFHGMNLQELIQIGGSTQDLELINYAGCVFNHFFYFSQLRPATGQIIIGISPNATTKITESFGNWKNMKDQFAEKAINIIGSGYVWLVKKPSGLLEIITTQNNEIYPREYTPIINLDLWEHSYFIKHNNDRKKYIEEFWNIIDWVKFSSKI